MSHACQHGDEGTFCKAHRPASGEAAFLHEFLPPLPLHPVLLDDILAKGIDVVQRPVEGESRRGVVQEHEEQRSHAVELYLIAAGKVVRVEEGRDEVHHRHQDGQDVDAEPADDEKLVRRTKVADRAKGNAVQGLHVGEQMIRGKEEGYLQKHAYAGAKRHELAVAVLAVQRGYHGEAFLPLEDLAYHGFHGSHAGFERTFFFLPAFHLVVDGQDDRIHGKAHQDEGKAIGSRSIKAPAQNDLHTEFKRSDADKVEEFQHGLFPAGGNVQDGIHHGHGGLAEVRHIVFADMQDALGEALVRGEFLNDAGELFQFGRVEPVAELFHHLAFPRGMRQAEGVEAALVQFVGKRDHRAQEDKGEVEDHAREVRHHDRGAAQGGEAVGVAIPLNVVEARQFALELFHERLFGNEALRMRAQDDLVSGFGKEARHGGPIAREHAVLAPRRGHEHAVPFGLHAVFLAFAAGGKGVHVRAADQRKLLGLRAALGLEQAQGIGLILAAAQHGVVIVEGEELVGVDVAQGVDDVDVLLHALGAANLQNVDAWRGEHEGVGLKEVQRGVGRVARADVAAGDAVRQVGLEAGVVLGGGEIFHSFATAAEFFQQGPERAPVVGRFAVDGDMLALQKFALARGLEQHGSEQRRELAHQKIRRRQQADEHGKEHTSRARVKVGVGRAGACRDQQAQKGRIAKGAEFHANPA